MSLFDTNKKIIKNSKAWQTKPFQPHLQYKDTIPKHTMGMVPTCYNVCMELDLSMCKKYHLQRRYKNGSVDITLCTFHFKSIK